jgi:demethylspheroidene O-methyltransferase
VHTVLRAIFDALPLGGTLLLAEPMAKAGGAPEPSDPYFHFYLMAMGSGRLRTPAELTKKICRCVRLPVGSVAVSASSSPIKP